MTTTLEPTPSQTVGPYLHIGMLCGKSERAAGVECAGEHVTIQGRVFDGNGEPVPDGLVEIWHADSKGRYLHPEDARSAECSAGFRGFACIATAADGSFRFQTVKPGPVPDGQGGMQAPHILVSVFMRGLLKRVVTRIYFPNEPANTLDRVLQLAPAERRHTLIAHAQSPACLEWSIQMQGPQETVFFDC